MKLKDYRWAGTTGNMDSGYYHAEYWTENAAIGQMVKDAQEWYKGAEWYLCEKIPEDEYEYEHWIEIARIINGNFEMLTEPEPRDCNQQPEKKHDTV